MNTAKRITLVEMETRLANDSTGTYRRELLEKMAHYKTQILHLLQRGDWTPAQFNALDQLKKAVGHAEAILQTTV